MIPKDILKKVRYIEIKTKSIVDALLSGEYHSAFKGKGMEFSEVRSYTDGDDIRSIDWNVTARMSGLYVKQHIEERELTVMLLVDASASGSFGSVNQMKAETAVEMCALMAFSAIKNNDRVGLIIFTSEVEKYVPPKKGKKHVLRVIRELLYFRPGHKGTNINEALRFLNRVQKKKAVVFLASDFFTSGFSDSLRVVSNRHDCVAVTLSDPREEKLPNIGLLELRDPETGETCLVDTSNRKIRERHERDMKKRKESISKMLRNAGVDEIAVSTETDYVEPLVRFFKKRERVR